MIVVLIQPPEGTAWRRVRDNLTRNAPSAPTRAEQAEAAEMVSTRSSPGPQSSSSCSWSSENVSACSALRSSPRSLDSERGGLTERAALEREVLHDLGCRSGFVEGVEVKAG